MQTYSWYAQLRKPSWAPPASVFGPVWTVLYLIIFISFTAAFGLVAEGVLPRIALIPFMLNIVANFAFTPLQFGLRNNVLASIDIVIILLTIIWAMIVSYPIVPWIALAQIPYLLWVTFATALQLTITVLNHRPS